MTGTAPVRTLFGSGSIMLYDGAEPVPAYMPWEFEAQTTYRSGDRLLATVVCCGPAAPRPGRYTETIEQVRGERSFVIREELPDGRYRTFVRQYHEHEVEAVGLDVLWRGIRAHYLRRIEGRWV